MLKIKRAVFIVSAVLLSSCIAKKEVYCIVINPGQRKEYPRKNRFEKQFHQADSAFMAKLRQASRQAAREASEQLKIKQVPVQ